MSNQSSYSLGSFISMINDNFVLILVAGLLAIAGFFVGSIWTENQILRGGKAANPSAANQVADPTGAAPVAQVDKVPEISDEDHILGSDKAKVILVEYSDFECPFCGRFHPTTQQIVEEFGDQVAVAYRHYPLSFHPNAQKAAEGSECVAKLAGNDAFWKYADSLFEVNSADGKLSPQAIQDAAQDAGVNLTAFNTCLDSDEMAEKVANQMAGGAAAGVSGTPGTIVVTQDGGQELISGALPFEQVKAAVEKYL